MKSSPIEVIPFLHKPDGGVFMTHLKCSRGDIYAISSYIGHPAKAWSTATHENGTTVVAGGEITATCASGSTALYFPFLGGE